MPKAITSLAVNTFVKDTGSLYNGVPIKWRIIDFNHVGYPADTVTLVAVIDRKVTTGMLKDTTRETTFWDLKLYYEDLGQTMGSVLTSFYDGLNTKLKERVKDTTLEVGYSGAYSSSRPRTKNMSFKAFLIGGREYNYGSGTSLESPTSQSYFALMKLFDQPSVFEMLTGSPLTQNDLVASRDVEIDSGSYYSMYPGSINNRYGDGDSATRAVRLLPIINVSVTDLTVLDTPEADGTYLLNLTENKFLVEDGNDIKRYFKPADTIVQEYTANLCTNYISTFIYSQDYNTAKQSLVDNNSGTYLQSAYNPTAAYVGYDFSYPTTGMKKHIRKIILDQTFGGSVGRALTVKVQVSTGQSIDGLWTDVGGIYTLNNPKGKSTIDLPVSKPMEVWRIVPQTQDLNYRWPISGLEMMELVDKTVVSPYQWETIGQKPVTKAMFDQYGMKELTTVTSSGIAALVESTPQLLCWTDDAELIPSRYVHQTVNPKAILLAMNNSIEVNELNAWRLDASIAGAGVFKVVYSYDEGLSWNGKTGPLTTLSQEEVKTKGFTVAEWNALTKLQLQQVSASKKLRLAFYLDRQNLSDVFEVRALFASEILYTASSSIASVSSQYEMLIKEEPTYQVSRNETNWMEIKSDELIDLSSLPEGKDIRVKVVLKNGIELHGISYSWS